LLILLGINIAFTIYLHYFDLSVAIGFQTVAGELDIAVTSVIIAIGIICTNSYCSPVHRLI
jgi:hypothetical protein